MTDKLRFSKIDDAAIWKPTKAKQATKAQLFQMLMDTLQKLAESRFEIDRAGGACATKFNGQLIIVHPDMPPHVWDGEKMERL